MSLRSLAHKLHEGAAVVLVGKAYIGLAVAVEPSNWGNRRQHGRLHVSHGQTWILRCYQRSSTCSQTQYQQIRYYLLAECNLHLRSTNATDVVTNNVATGDQKDVEAAAGREGVCI